MATVFIYRDPALLGSNLLQRRKQFINSEIVKALETVSYRIRFYPVSFGFKTGF